MEMNDQNLISEEIEKKLKEIGVRAKTAAVDLSSLSTVTKNRVLCDAADLLIERTQDILKANAEDWKHAVEKQMPKGLLDRLTLTSERRIGQWIETPPERPHDRQDDRAARRDRRHL